MPPTTIEARDDKSNRITQTTNADSTELAALNQIVSDKDVRLTETKQLLKTAIDKYTEAVGHIETQSVPWDRMVRDFNQGHQNRAITQTEWNINADNCITSYINKENKSKEVAKAQSDVELATSEKATAIRNVEKKQEYINRGDSSSRTDRTLSDALASDKSLKSLNVGCYTESVKSGEVCTIAAAKHYDIFDSKKYFNNTYVSEKDILKIDKHINNAVDKSLPYSLCTVNNSNAFQNCAITYKNPWVTLDKSDNNYCKMPKNVELPKGFSYQAPNKIKKPGSVFRYKPKIGYCQEKWYDWFTIPDYHLGNKVTVLTEPNKPNNIVNCYKPCSTGYIPRDDTNVQFINNCVLKEYYNYGLYKGTFNYLPIALILLLGSTKKSLKEYYLLLLNDAKNNIITNNLILDNDVYNKLYEDNSIFTAIYDYSPDPSDYGMKYSIKNRIDELFRLPFEIENIIIPNENIIEVSKPIISKIKIEQAYKICKNYYELLTDANKRDKLNEWLIELASVTGELTTSEKFKKQLAILQKACNVTFDGKSKYSKDYILYNLNKDIDLNEVPNPPIEFNLLSRRNLLTSAEAAAAAAAAAGGGGGGGPVPPADTTGTGQTTGIQGTKVKIVNNQAHLRDILINFTPFADAYKKYPELFSKLQILGIILIILVGVAMLFVLYFILEPYVLLSANFIYTFIRNTFTLLIYDTFRHVYNYNQYTPPVYGRDISFDDYKQAVSRLDKVKSALEKKKAIDAVLAKSKPKTK